MTDQAQAIASAVKTVWPNVFHGLCTWHIKQNASRNLGAFAKKKFFDHFNHLIDYVDDEAQFELEWKDMITECIPDPASLKTNWLQRTYENRKQWSAAWVKPVFTAGRTTTQMSEQLNA